MKICCVFPEGKTKVLTLSYDDGTHADKKLISILNRYGIKATFNLNFGLMKNEERIDADEIKKVYEGHEIATHTFSHLTLTRCPYTEIVREILEDKKGLERLTGKVIRGHAYPNGVYNKEIKDLFRKLGIAYARTIEEKEEYGNFQKFDLPEDWMEWRPTCHHKNNLMKHAENFVDFKKTQYLKCMYVWGHSFEFERNDNWNLLEEFCAYISDRADIWYATNIEIREYMEAFERLQFSADGTFVYNPSICDVWLNVDESIIKISGGKTINLV